MPDPRQITIADELFTVTPPYAAGHQINDAEAKALNQTWCEAIRNNTAKKVKAAVEAGNRSEAEKIVSEYVTQYEFSVRTAAASVKLDPIEREARKIAKELLYAKIEAKGKKPSDYEKDQLVAKIIEISETNEEVRKEATKRVKAQSKFAAEVGLGDLEI